MSIDERGREAAERARSGVATIAVPEPEAVVHRRRGQHRARNVVVGAGVVLVLIGGAAAVVGVTRTDSQPQVAVRPATTHRRATLEFRVVQGQLPYSQCKNLLTQGEAPGPVPVVLADAGHKVCYQLGPTVLLGAAIQTATAEEDPSIAPTEWVVNVHFNNDDFVTKVARPYVNKQIAIIVDGVVQSAPTLNPGITGPDFTISGGFTKTQALDLAAHLLGVDPSAVTVPTTTPIGGPPVSLAPKGLALLATVPTSCPFQGVPNCIQKPETVTSADVSSVSVRSDGSGEWLIAITLNPQAASKVAHDTLFIGAIDTQQVAAQRESANTLFLGRLETPARSPLPGFDRATADRLAARIRATR